MAVREVERLTIREERRGALCTLQPRGDLVLATVPMLKACLDAHMQADAKTVLELSHIELGELLIAPLLGAGAVGQLGQRPGGRRCLQRAEQVRELRLRPAHAISAS
jgi:hypothetical protein